MVESIKNLSSQGWQIAHKYLSIYMEWLSWKLDGENAFGTLAMAGIVALFILLIYIYAKNNLD